MAKLVIEIDTDTGKCALVTTTGTVPATVDKTPYKDQDGIELIPDDDPRMCAALAVQPNGYSLTGWPRIVRTPGGVNYQAWGPLNKRIISSMYAHVFGHQAGTSVFTGQNGHTLNPPRADSSPNGWPIQYTVNPVSGELVGTPTYYSGDGSYNSEEELEAHVKMLEDYRSSMAKPKPTVQGRTEPLDSYSSRDKLIEDLHGLSFGVAVLLDGQSVWTGFGPALSYVTQGDGSVRRGQYVTSGGGGGGGDSGGGGTEVTIE